MGSDLVIILLYPATFTGVCIVVWVLFSLVWYLGGRIGRATGANTRIDQFLDPNGVVMPVEERIKDDGGFRGGIGGP